MQSLFGNMSSTELLLVVLNFLLMIPALVLHELAHGWVAYRLGDTTAKRAGRLSLNPLKHIDPFGTLLMPAMLFFFTSALGGRAFAFGYAKPVPINPNNFRDRRKGILLTGIAGPVMNILLAIGSSILYLAVYLMNPTHSAGSVLGVIGLLLYQFAFINLMFAFFNLIPIPPLDGSRVLQYFLPRSALHFYAQLERWGFIILIAVMWLTPLFTWYINATAGSLMNLLPMLVGLG
ncbi:MAG: site-2 protease family protein [Coriobacteriia bacterium]|nr:site-2 protease family protein [Coriobacteriia bacterium]